MQIFYYSILKTLASRLSAVTFRLIGVIGLFFPKKRTLVVFGARNGEYYMDNSKDLFEWVLANNTNIDAVWLTKNKNVLEELRLLGKPVVNIKTIKGLYILMRASVVVYSNRLLDVAPHWAAVPNTIKCIWLSHGTPVKKYRFTLPEIIMSDDFADDIKKASRLCKLAIASSDFVAYNDAMCQQINIEKYRITGYPRNDRVLNPSVSMKIKWQEFVGGGDYNSIVLYAPTWRKIGGKVTRFFPFDDFDIVDLQTYLNDKKILLLLRPHIQEVSKTNLNSQLFNACKNGVNNIKLATVEQFADANDLLPFVDILITDYSSIMNDFLLLDKPILLFPYDYEEFLEVNGFLYDYFDNLPGPHIKSFLDMKSYLNKLYRSIDDHQTERRRLAVRLHRYFDSDSSNRVAELIEEMINV